MIQYGINTFIWASPFQTKDLHYLDHAKALGVDLVEVPIESAGDVDYGAAAEAYARTGLACTTGAVMGAGRDPSHPDEKIQQAGIAYLKHCIDGTARMGGKFVVGPLYAAVDASGSRPRSSAWLTWRWSHLTASRPASST